MDLPYWVFGSRRFVKHAGLIFKDRNILLDILNNQNTQQDRHCTCNVNLGRVHETTIAVESQYVLHISVYVCGACVRVCGGG